MPPKKSASKKSASKKASAKKATAKRVKKEPTMEKKGKIMEEIHMNWDDLTTAQKKAVAHCARSIHDNNTSVRKLNTFLEKQYQKKTGKKSGKQSGKKRAPSAFFAFLKGVRAEIKKNYPDTSVTDVAVVAGALWKKMNDEQKAKKKIDALALNAAINNLDVDKPGVKKAMKRKRSKEE